MEPLHHGVLTRDALRRLDKLHRQIPPLWGASDRDLVHLLLTTHCFTVSLAAFWHKWQVSSVYDSAIPCKIVRLAHRGHGPLGVVAEAGLRFCFCSDDALVSWPISRTAAVIADAFEPYTASPWQPSQRLLFPLPLSPPFRKSACHGCLWYCFIADWANKPCPPGLVCGSRIDLEVAGCGVYTPQAHAASHRLGIHFLPETETLSDNESLGVRTVRLYEIDIVIHGESKEVKTFLVRALTSLGHVYSFAKEQTSLSSSVVWFVRMTWAASPRERSGPLQRCWTWYGSLSIQLNARIKGVKLRILTTG